MFTMAHTFKLSEYWALKSAPSRLGEHVPARAGTPTRVEPPSLLAAPGACTTMAASLPEVKPPENSSFLWMTPKR